MLFFLAAIEDIEERTKIEQIFELYAKKMHQVAFAILHDNFDAEDAVQIAMFNACKHVKKLQDPQSRNAKWYVMQATKNAAKNIYKKKRGRWKREGILEEGMIGDDSLPGYNEGSALSKHIAKLSPRDRDILMLKYVHGYDYAEIAGILGMTNEAAKKAGQRAKQRLEESLREEEKSND